MLGGTIALCQSGEEAHALDTSIMTAKCKYSTGKAENIMHKPENSLINSLVISMGNLE